MAYGTFGPRRRLPAWAESRVIRRDHVDYIPRPTRGNLEDDQIRDIERVARAIPRTPPRAGVFGERWDERGLPERMSGQIPRQPPRAGVFGEQPMARVPDPSDASRRANFDQELAMQGLVGMLQRRRLGPRRSGDRYRAAGY